MTVDMVASLMGLYLHTANDQEKLCYLLPRCICVKETIPLDVISHLLYTYADLFNDSTYIEGKDSLIHIAVANKNTSLEVISHLMKAFPRTCRRLDAFDRLPLHVACRNPYISTEILSYLIEVYPDACKSIDSSQSLPLHYICSIEGQPENAIVIVHAYPDACRAVDKVRMIPLSYALACQCFETIQYLLETFSYFNQLNEDVINKFPLKYICKAINMPVEMLAKIL